MAHYTLIARMNAGDGKFPFVNVQLRKIIVRFQSRQPTTSARATAVSVRRFASARISLWLTPP